MIRIISLAISPQFKHILYLDTAMQCVTELLEFQQNDNPHFQICQYNSSPGLIGKFVDGLERQYSII